MLFTLVIYLYEGFSFNFFYFFTLQVLGESLYISKKYSNYEEKIAMAQSKVDSLFFENELLKTKVKSLSDEMEKAQDHLKTSEKEVNNKKALSKLKDKQIDDAQLKIQKGSPKAMEKFKNSDEYSDKLCDYYIDGFELFRKYMAKHHPDLDFSTLDMEVVEKEILANRPSTSVAAGHIDDGAEGAVVTVEARVDPSPSNLP